MNKPVNNPSNGDLLAALRNGDERALDQIFHDHYAYLCRAVYRVLPDAVMAEDLVQEVFLELWRKRAQLNISQSLRAYLRRAAINRTLNYIRDQKLVVDDEAAMPIHLSSQESNALQQLQAEELEDHLKLAIDRLPERCRLVFGLSRFEGLSNKEIATQLSVSIKTVENQMTKALKLLRSALANYSKFVTLLLVLLW